MPFVALKRECTGRAKPPQRKLKRSQEVVRTGFAIRKNFFSAAQQGSARLTKMVGLVAACVAWKTVSLCQKTAGPAEKKRFSPCQ
jgi:hypothetical protein